MAVSAAPRRRRSARAAGDRYRRDGINSAACFVILFRAVAGERPATAIVATFALLMFRVSAIVFRRSGRAACFFSGAVRHRRGIHRARPVPAADRGSRWRKPLRFARRSFTRLLAGRIMLFGYYGAGCDHGVPRNRSTAAAADLARRRDRGRRRRGCSASPIGLIAGRNAGRWRERRVLPPSLPPQAAP